MKSKYINFLLNENEINKIAKDILSDISHNIFETSDISVSCEALNKRLNSKFVKFLKAIFSKLLNMSLNIENSDKTTKSSLNRILLTDSSICKLHNSLKKEYPGGRNGECAYNSFHKRFEELFSCGY